MKDHLMPRHFILAVMRHTGCTLALQMAMTGSQGLARVGAWVRVQPVSRSAYREKMFGVTYAAARNGRTVTED